jgi:hypothetical protein
VLWFGSGYGGCDPPRWSPVSVEIFLVDWVPRKIVAPACDLAPMPDVLRAFIRFAHAERGIRPTLTDETLAAVTEYGPEYLRIIAKPRLQGPAATLAAMGFDADAALDEMDWESWLLEGLAVAVGGAEQLDRLSIEPLPDEAFDWSGIEQDIRVEVDAVLTASDAAALALFDIESRTAARRLLRQVALAEPAIFRRGARPAGSAGAVGWLVAKANNAYGDGVTTKAHLKFLGLSGSVSQRARAMLRALHLPDNVSIALGSPQYLTSKRRAEIIEQRDRLRADH